ncbi:MFS transporter [Roseibium album]|uniref:Spectinomycin tetracycline efflux pump n=1 Tax=Roseibium album TaxID=311410 RepID=A0A0M6ZE91_9HYPH|nr:MFS transporter [Roseibium album]MBG6162124.1 DHA2 family methylenomycin A resistance protein-like MFS transporter [Labrenzia sp. EL_195]MBG6199391.1 DHA2 family methylenomycin A resistance protein-like MFS transporter [Labrenzia sp. EL_13]CTQ61108.1 Spectinomycin tetracycline efflux pump [Roseibium album]CTQ63921.1 Spectinomycin tetracycline efflux pump [Roseibium album]CTQ72395.1 Spectinomycin tetracycline efflux pump [Roseibium album]
MDSRAKRILGAVSVPSFMIGTDFTGAMLLVTPIEQEYSVDITTTQWVLNAYALTLSMGLVAGGRLGDLLGHRRYVLIGLGIFFAASIACVFAPTVSALIFARAAQGVGSALIWPCILALAATSVEEDERGKAMGILMGTVAGGNVLAPFIAGSLAALGDWRGFFVFNAVFAVIAALLIFRFIDREKEHARDETVDLSGMAVLAIAVFCLLFGLDTGADNGWFNGTTLLLFAGALVFFAAFPFVEKFVKDPMIPLPMMRNHQFVRTLALNGLPAIVLFLCLLYLPQYMQKVLGWSIFWSSMGMLPLAVVVASMNLAVGNYYNSIGPRKLMAAGHAFLVLGCVLMLFLQTSWGYVALVPVMIVVGIGGGLVFGPAGTAAVNAVGAQGAGLAGGLSFMFHLGLGAIGIACATAMMFVTAIKKVETIVSSAGIKLPLNELRVLAAGTLDDPAVKSITERYSGKDIDVINTAVRDSFAAGLHAAFWFGLAVAIIGVVVSVSLDESKLRTDAPEDDAAEI